MKQGKLYGIGIGPGDPELLTLKSVRILRSCGVIFTVISQHATESISEKIVHNFAPKGHIVRLSFSMSCVAKEREKILSNNSECIACELKKGTDCAFATLGDPLTYSTYGYVLKRLHRLLPELETETVPGITSYSTLAAQAGCILAENTQSLHIIPSFRSAMAETLALDKNSSTILLKTYHSRHALIERLRHEKDSHIVYGENLTLPGEFISRDLDEIDARPENYLSLMLVKKN